MDRLANITPNEWYQFRQQALVDRIINPSKLTINYKEGVRYEISQNSDQEWQADIYFPEHVPLVQQKWEGACLSRIVYISNNGKNVLLKRPTETVLPVKIFLLPIHSLLDLQYVLYVLKNKTSCEEFAITTYDAIEAEVSAFVNTVLIATTKQKCPVA